MRDIDIEIMQNLLEETDAYGLLTEDQVKYIVKGFMGYMESEKEMSFYAHKSSHKQECEDCKNLKLRLKESERDIEVYKENVRVRRGATSVYIEGDQVMYNLR